MKLLVFQTGCSRKGSQPSCCMFSTASASRPAANTMSTTPMTRKNSPRLRRRPSLKITYAIVIATASPTTAPRSSAFPWAPVADWVDEANTMARVNTIVSSPSRPTAWNASRPKPKRALPLRAFSERRWRSADMVRLWDCIQKVM